MNKEKMATDNDILNNIPDSKPVRVFIPLKNMSERFRLQGVYQKSTPPVFSLFFKAGVLPVETVDTTKPCIISVDMGGPTISLEANITDVTSSQQLVMTAIKAMSHEQMREFFRVDAVTGVIGRSFQSSVKVTGKDDWTMSGETIDISGSGILATFTSKPPQKKNIQLDLTLPTDDSDIIRVLARVIRVVQNGENQFDIAFHFDEISTEDRDKIIGCCLEIQRKLLRLKVKVKDL